MAQRLGVDKQKLQQFVSDSPWESQALWQTVRAEIVPVLGPIDSWIVDETGWIKQGDKSVGVAHQYCGSVGKKANCQVSVHIALSNGEAALPMAARLFLPQARNSTMGNVAAAQAFPRRWYFAASPRSPWI